MAVVIGSAGFSLPLFLAWTMAGNTHDVFLSLLRAGTLASFSIVLLAEGLAGALAAKGAGTSLHAAGLRGLVSVFALAVTLVQVTFLAVENAMADGRIPSPASQVVVTGLAVICASYLYCFRFASWERGAEAVREADDQSVEALKESAKETTSDDHGVRL